MRDTPAGDVTWHQASVGRTDHRVPLDRPNTARAMSNNSSESLSVTLTTMAGSLKRP
ncbi:hypothetical protein Ais01nite_02540 [Asanoa ishikariensis]|nr:hypothetical protein Ais01nite_02540 [Asanoa ishikariensis]